MMTTNQLTKTFASGSLAIGVLAGAVLTATSASAASILTWEEWTNPNLTLRKDLHVGDKIVKFVGVNNFGAQGLDQVGLVSTSPDDYYFSYNAFTSGAEALNQNSGSFTYTIEVTDPNRAITGVDLGSTVTANYGTVTETFAEIPNTLVSVNGSSVPPTGFIPIDPIKKLTVTNTLANANPNTQGLFQLQNSFHQKTKVPEPATILGLLAVGGLGLVSSFKKQK